METVVPRARVLLITLLSQQFSDLSIGRLPRLLTLLLERFVVRITQRKLLFMRFEHPEDSAKFDLREVKTVQAPPQILGHFVVRQPILFQFGGGKEGAQSFFAFTSNLAQASEIRLTRTRFRIGIN